MKRRALAWTAALLLALAPAVLAEIPVPEFDGAYIVTRDGELVELDSKTGMNHTVMKGPGTYFSFRGRPEPGEVKSRNIQGFAIRGSHDFSDISLAFMIPFDSSIPGKEPDNFYSGFPVDFRKKSIGADTYYLQPRQAMPAGKYMIWTGNTVWPFRLTGMECPGETDANDPVGFVRSWAVSNWAVSETDLPPVKNPADVFESWKLGLGSGYAPEKQSLVILEASDALPGGLAAVVTSVRTTDEEIGDNQVARYLTVHHAGPRLDGSDGPVACDAEWRLERMSVVQGETRFGVKGYLYSPVSFDCEAKQREASENLWQIMRQVLMYRSETDKLPEALADIGFSNETFKWYDFEVRTSHRGVAYVRAKSRAPGITSRGAGDDVWEMDERGNVRHIVDACF